MILLVEDSVLLRECLVEALVPQYEVIVAGNGIDALRQFERHRTTLDLLLTDLMMPQMNGAELVEQVRRQTQAMPIIVMTGNGADALAALRFNNVSLLLKPFGTEALLERIAQVTAFCAP